MSKQTSIAEVSAPDLGEGPIDVRVVIGDLIEGAPDVTGVEIIAAWLDQQHVEGSAEIVEFLRNWPSYRLRKDGRAALLLVLRRLQSALTESIH